MFIYVFNSVSVVHAIELDLQLCSLSRVEKVAGLNNVQNVIRYNMTDSSNIVIL